MTGRKLAALALVVLVLTGGISASPYKTPKQTGFSIIFLSDLHMDGPLGSGQYGRDRLRKMISESNADSRIVAWIVDGDFNTGGFDTADTTNTVTVEMLRDTLAVPCYPAIGNHEWAVADTGTGDIYNDFIGYWGPEIFDAYTDANRRGRRWYSANPKLGGYPTTARIFVVNNNRYSFESNGGNDRYYVNNPHDGSGVDSTDFDGISDSTSVQRVDMKRWLQGLDSSLDWPILVQHRSKAGIANSTGSTGRPDQEGIDADADSSQIMWLDANWPHRFIVLDGDEHSTKAQDFTTYTVFSASVNFRNLDTDRLSAWSSETLTAVMNDTSFTNSSGVALADSVGADSDVQTDEGGLQSWHCYWRFDFEPGTFKAVLRLVQNNDATCTIDSLVFTR